MNKTSSNDEFAFVPTEATTQRLRLRAAGFSPVPVKDKYPPIVGWQEMVGASEAEIIGWQTSCAYAESSGIITKHNPAADIDLKHPQAANAVEELAFKLLCNGDRAPVRFGNPPRRAILFRTDEPFKVIRLEFDQPRDPDEPKKKQAIEILGDGQQVVAFGIHPKTNRPYRWTGGEPGEVKSEDLPTITRRQAIDFLVAAEKLLVESFAFKDPKRSWDDSDDEAYADKRSSEPRASIKRVRAALNAIPNNDAHYNDWVRVGMATWHATDGSADGFVAWDAWSQKSTKYDAAFTSKTWAGFHKRPPHSLGAGTLFRFASEADPNWESGTHFGTDGRKESSSNAGDHFDDWRDDLMLTPTKQPRPLLANALVALRKAPEWQGVLAYDDFALTTMAVNPPPWLRGQHNSWVSQCWTDRDDVLTTDWLQHQGIGITVTVAAAAVEAVAKDATFHPVRDYLSGLTWDGTKRVTSFAETYLGAEATDYHRNVSRCMLIAAVARVMRPGCKHDHMPILEGPQDKFKSTAIESLFTPWFTDDLAELGTKDASMQVRAAWGIEVAELSAMTRGEIERVKAFITRKVDRFRPSYGRRVIEVPRQSVFVGSTNNDAYLKDETGGRRFWPIRCGTIDPKAIKGDRDQLWAEAVTLFKGGTAWWLTETTAVTQAREQQTDRYQQDPWQQAIAKYCEDRDDVSIEDILSNLLEIERAKWTQTEQNRVAHCLTQMGWCRYRTSKPPRQWRYRPVG